MSTAEKNVKESIVEASRSIFARFGYKKTTVDEIAQASNKAKSSVYHYFKNKEDIFRSIVEKESLIFIEKITEAINKEELPQKKLRAYFLIRMHTINQLANLYSAIKDEYLKQYSYIEELRASHDREEIKIITDILSEGIEKGIFKIKNLSVIASPIFTALKGLEYYWIYENNVSTIDDNIDNLLDILFYGIVKR